MGKLAVLSGREVCRILADQGFTEVRRRGSHIVMQNRTLGTTITVPVANRPEIRIPTLGSIIRQSQLPRSLIEVK